MSLEQTKLIDSLIGQRNALTRRLESMEARLCKTCQHWDTSGVDEPEHACNAGSAEGIKGDKGFFVGDGYHALLTGPEFGCVHWIKNEK